MFKKIIKSIAFFALFQIFIFSCCTQDYNLYYDSLYFTAEDNEDGDATTITSEDLILNLNPLFDYIVASNFKELKRFSTTAYATSCNENYTLKEHVSEIIITANQDILGVTAGNSLNSKFSYKNPDTLENETVEGIIEVLNRENGNNYNRKDFILNEAIAEGTSLTFTVKIMILENGRTLEATTDIIIIE